MQNLPNTSFEIYPSPDFIKLALAAEIKDKPGSVFSYNNKAANLLAGIVQYVSKMKLDNYLSEKIFEPMGINNYKWKRDDEGNPQCMAGFQVNPKDMAKLGQLFINKGKWEGKLLINADWFTETVKPNNLNKESGLLWWIEYAKTKATIDDNR